MDTKSLVVAVPVQSLPKAELVVMEVSRLRPKGTEECKLETQELLDMVAYLQGSVPSGPGVPPMRWPANLGMDFYITRAPSTILSCKVCTCASRHLCLSWAAMSMLLKSLVCGLVHVGAFAPTGASLAAQLHRAPALR